jgi:hypothetical protein
MIWVSLEPLVEDLDERTIAARVGNRHDAFRAGYVVFRNTVSSFDELEYAITTYYSAHFSACVAKGAQLPPHDVYARVTQILERHYARRGGSLITAFHDVCDGTNGGLRVILDVIADALKAEDIEAYIQYTFARHVEPHDFDAKVELIRQLLARFGTQLGPGIRIDRPEMYAHDYQPLVRAFVNLRQQARAVFRRY